MKVGFQAAITGVTAIIVTRGDVDLWPVIKTMPVGVEVIVWNNAVEKDDLAVYGRYAAIERAKNNVIYVQDDDCLVDVMAVVAAYQPGLLVANMPTSRWKDYPDSCLVGWGAVFDRGLPSAAFDRFPGYEPGLAEGWWLREAIYRECDVVFTTLTPHVKIDVGFEHLPWAEDPARAMFLAPRPDRDAVYALARKVRDS